MEGLITKGDYYQKKILNKIIREGTMDENPRPRWADDVPAHTLSINHEMMKYDLDGGDCPFITLRPTAIKSAIGEILWIYQDQSNDLDLLKDKYGVTWWDEWDCGDRTIGSCYGSTVAEHDLMNELLNGLVNDPDGRRHIISLWQNDDFQSDHGLKPCCFQNIYNVRHGAMYNYVDCMMIQRSSDYLTSGSINEIQYIALLNMIVGHMNTYKKSSKIKGYVPGVFTHVIANAQIYDRHMDAAREIINRESIVFEDTDEMPEFAVPSKDFYEYTVEDFRIMNNIQSKVKEVNPQIKLEIAI